MARKMTRRAEALYGAAERIVDAGLRTNGSLFRPEAEIWCKPAFEQLVRRFVENPDVTSGVSFLDKLEGQIRQADSPAIRLMAELLFVHFLITNTISGRKKREIIETVLGWTKGRVSIPEDLAEALDHGRVNPGTYYNTGRDAQLSFLIRFGSAWKDQPQDEANRVLTDPWEFKKFVHGVEVGSGYSQRSALLHLVHPEYFDAITSREHKQLISSRFAEHVTDSTEDVDRRILQVREALAPKYGQHFTFYDHEVEPLWRHPAGAWDAFVKWAAKFRTVPDFDEMESTYKLALVTQFRAAREALLSGDSKWVGELRRAFSQKDYNLTSWQTNDRFLRWVEANPETAAAAIEIMWAKGEPGTERIRSFLSRVPASELSGPGARLSIASVLLMTMDAASYPPFRPEPFRKAYALTDTAVPARDADEAELYDFALDFLDRFIQQGESRQLEIKDRLDAQGLVWAVTKWKPPDTWSAADRNTFLAFRGEDLLEDASPQALAEDLFMAEEHLQRMVRLVESRGQVIFHGPPGTGKTFVALQLARFLAGADGDVEMVQFHPSYTYEDFVEGYRPAADGKGFSLRPGPLKRFAERARANPAAKFVLVIDRKRSGCWMRCCWRCRGSLTGLSCVEEQRRAGPCQQAESS